MISGRLSLYKNQIGDDGTCECVVVKENTLFSSCYDSTSNTGAVNGKQDYSFSILNNRVVTTYV